MVCLLTLQRQEETVLPPEIVVDEFSFSLLRPAKSALVSWALYEWLLAFGYRIYTIYGSPACVSEVCNDVRTSITTQRQLIL